MEFVVTNIKAAQAGAGPSDQLLSLLTEKAFSRWFGPMSSLQSGQVTLFAPEKTLAKLATTAQGMLFAGHAHIDDERTLVHQLANEGVFSGDRNALRHTNGVYVALTPTVDGFSLWTDPSGLYPLHLYREGGTYVISNNPHMLHEIVKLDRPPLRRGVEALGYALTYGTNFDRAGSFEGVHLTPPRTRYDLSRTGALQETEHLSIEQVYTTDLSYDQAVDALAEKMKTRMNSLFDLGQKTCVDLTAGVDSRLVLAAALSTGRRDAFGIYNFGRRPNPDRVIPEHLITKFGLSPTDAVLSNEEVHLALADRIPLGAFKFCGLRTLDQPDVGPYVLPNVTRVSGALGELGMGVAPTHAIWALHKRGPAAYAEKWFGGREPRNLFVTCDAMQMLKDRTTAIAGELGDAGLPPSHVDQVFYAEHRAPYHFGIAHRFFNDVRYHIPGLNFLEQSQCGYRLGIRESRKRKLHLDLMLRLAGPELALEPMGGFRWEDEFVPETHRDAYASVERFTGQSQPLCPPVAYPQTLQLSYPKQSALELQIAEQTAKKGLNARFRNAFVYREQIRKVWEEIPQADRVWDFIDRNEVETMLGKSTDDMLDMLTDQQVKFGRIGILSNALSWYAGIEQPCAVFQDGRYRNDGSLGN